MGSTDDDRLVMPKYLCMAPWTHTYLSPQTERRMCCASREPAQNFEQYIDTDKGTGEYSPLTLDEHWNSEHMKSVRRRMMAGEELPECEVCNDKLLNTDVYRSYFNKLFAHKYNELVSTTDSTGHTSMKPVSWDYRFSNLCNFKCRMCGDMLSSSWEAEQRKHDMIDWSNPKNNWMKSEIKSQITKFQDEQIEQEFAQAVEEHRVEEVYWVGGEPLMYEQHWRYMKRIIDLGDGDKVYARYNTNLSRVRYRGINLFSDILDRLRDWQICASLDGTGKVGEYIRTGLNYESWLENFFEANKTRNHRRQLRIDFTLTTPGLFEIQAIQNLAKKLEVDILAKVIFSFSPDILLSPLALPRELLEAHIKSLGSCMTVMQDVLDQCLNRPNFQETFGDDYETGLIRGKKRIKKLEEIRRDTFTMSDCLQGDIKEWYDAIPD